MRNVYDYAGYNLHVCLICDGYEMTDKKVGVFASSAGNAGDLKVGLNQVVIAAADGALAATQIWRDIRRSTPAKTAVKKVAV